MSGSRSVFVPTARRYGSSQHSGSTMTAKGDYYFVIPAPATRVVPGPGSESQPGLRDLGIVWQGFANKHRVLSATATLKIAEAAPALPLRISVERGGDGWAVRLTNATRRRLQAVAGQTTRAALQRVLARLRAEYHRTPVVAGLWQVAGQPSTSQRTRPGRSAPAGARDAVGAGAARGAGGRAARRAAATGTRLHRPWRGPADGTAAGRARPAARDPPDGGRARPGPRPAACPAGRARIGCHIVVVRALPRHARRHRPELCGLCLPHGAGRGRADGDGVVGRGDTLAIVLGIVLGAAALVGLAVLWARS